MVKRVNKRKLPSFETKTLRVGYFGTQKYDDGTSLVDVAQWNEYGTKTSPPRPFMRYAVEENGQSWVDSVKDGLRNGLDSEQALRAVATVIVGDIRRSISNGTYIENRPMTLFLKDRFPKGDYTNEDFIEAMDDYRKGKNVKFARNTPLRWSGKMFQEIMFEVD